MVCLRHQNYKNENFERKNLWRDWLITQIPKLIRKMVGGVKGKIISLFKTNTTKNYSELARDNNVFGVCKKPRKLKIKKNNQIAKQLKLWRTE